MKSNYFNVTVKPDMSGEVGTTVFGDGDVMFDWTSFEVPRGACKLIGVTTLVKGKNGARQEFASDLYFAKSDADKTDPTTLGNVNGSASASIIYFNNIIGAMNIPVTDFRDGLDYVAVSYTGSSPATTGGMILEGVPNSGSTVGTDTLYLAVLAGGAFDFNTGSLLNQAGDQGSASGTTTLTTDGTDAKKVFSKGDIIIAQDDAAIGTVISTTTATVVVDEVRAALEDDDELMNKNPITYILHFQK